MQQQNDDRLEAVEIAMAKAEAAGQIETRTHRLILSPTSSEIKVLDLRTGMLVAFSSTRADYGQSLGEFVSDYIVP